MMRLGKASLYACSALDAYAAAAADTSSSPRITLCAQAHVSDLLSFKMLLSQHLLHSARSILYTLLWVPGRVPATKILVTCPNPQASSASAGGFEQRKPPAELDQ
jgi:hypothetical protein